MKPATHGPMPGASGKKIHILTFGCQMNEYESDRTYRLFHDRYGFSWCDTPGEADLVIFNTCSIREKADHKAFSALGLLAQEKQERSDMIIAVGGCSAQIQGEQIQSRYPFVDIVFGTHQWNQLPNLIERVAHDRQRALDIDLFGWQRYSFLDLHPSQERHPVADYVTVQNGCDKFCTFCLVPFTRGRQLSRSLQDIDAEIRMLVDKGVREVMLLGQNVNAYGRDRRGEVNFTELLKHVAHIHGLKRVKFITSHPAEFTTEMVDVMADHPALCEFLHFPIQSGSDEILRRMNRNYTLSDVRRLIEYYRKKIPHGSLTTDMIIAFPGETREQFESSLAALREFEFDDSFSFCYSPRPQTKAAQWTHDFIDPSEAKERLMRYQSEQTSISHRRKEALIGQFHSVLVEGPAAKNDGKLTGKTRSHWSVNFEGHEDLIGQEVSVKLVKRTGNTFLGELDSVSPQFKNLDATLGEQRPTTVALPGLT